MLSSSTGASTYRRKKIDRAEPNVANNDVSTLSSACSGDNTTISSRIASASSLSTTPPITPWKA